MAKFEDIYPLLIAGDHQGDAPLVTVETLGSADDRSTGDERNSVSILVFSVGDRRFGVAIENTEGVVECPDITPLPSGPEGFIGVVSVRGRITLVVDASLNEAKGNSRRRLILLRGESQLGLIADAVHDLMAVPTEEMKTMPERRVSRRLLGGTSGGKQNIVLAREYFRSGGKRVPVIDLQLLAQL